MCNFVTYVDVYVDVIVYVNCVRGCVWTWTCGTNGDGVSRGAVGCKRVVELDMSEFV